MASRSKKKAKNSDSGSAKLVNPRVIEAHKTLQKLHTAFPYVVIAVAVLVLVCLCLKQWIVTHQLLVQIPVVSQKLLKMQLYILIQTQLMI